MSEKMPNARMQPTRAPCSTNHSLLKSEAWTVARQNDLVWLKEDS